MTQDDNTLPEVPGPQAIDIFGRTNPHSLINKVPGAVQEAVFQAHKKRPELFGLDERALMRKLKEENKMPSPTDNRLRVKFWHEYDFACENNIKPEMGKVFARICSGEYFYSRYLTNTEKVAWLMCMPASYENKMKEMLEFGLEQLREILDLPVVNAQGRVDTKLAELKAKIYAMVELREKGAIIQKVQNTSLNINTSDKTVAHMAMQGSMDQIEKRIKELERRDRTKPAEIEVKSEPHDDASDR